MRKVIKGNLVDVFLQDIYPAEITIKRDRIEKVKKIRGSYNIWLVPGFIDAHIHIESSLLCPSRFAEASVPQGTTSIIADPHEIANVLGIEGIRYMIMDSKRTPMRAFFTAPSCVPATPFETSGGIISVKDIEEMMTWDEIVGLGEVMDFPGVINQNKDVISKLNAAKRFSKPIDGHAPLLSGDNLKKYVSFGISTDHECTNLKEAREKAGLGVKIMVREGSASKNLKALHPILKEFDNVMLVSDDLHPDELLKGHMVAKLREAVALGNDPLKVISAVTINPARHYFLDLGALLQGTLADIVEIGSLKRFDVKRVHIGGKLVAEEGKALFMARPRTLRPTVIKLRLKEEDFQIHCKKKKVRVKVIQVIPNQILTKSSEATLEVMGGNVRANILNDVLKIGVVNRYKKAPVANGFVKGFNLKKGALASTVAHDSHNLIIVGTEEGDMRKAGQLLIDSGGGLSAVSGNEFKLIELPIAGLMSGERAEAVSRKMYELNSFAGRCGCKLQSPFITLSFLALLVIPELKLSDRGLFDSRKFRFVDVFLNRTM